MDEMTFLIMRVVVSVVGVIVAYYLVPLLKQAIEKAEDEKLADFIRAAVYAAQQTMKGESGEKRKEWVLEMVSDWLTSHKIKITAEQISLLIESAVLAMKIETK